jgi:hypothetical protein
MGRKSTVIKSPHAEEIHDLARGSRVSSDFTPAGPRRGAPQPAP